MKFKDKTKHFRISGALMLLGVIGMAVLPLAIREAAFAVFLTGGFYTVFIHYK